MLWQLQIIIIFTCKLIISLHIFRKQNCHVHRFLKISKILVVMELKICVLISHNKESGETAMSNNYIMC